MTYSAPIDEHLFLYRNVIGLQGLVNCDRYSAVDEQEYGEILAAVGALASRVLQPLQIAGDREPARLENGIVVTSAGYAEGFRAIAEGGWMGISASPEYGGSGLPVSLTNAANEMLNGACMALGLSPLLTQAQIRALEDHASEEIRRVYLPKLISGDWLGTMNISEPQAGSDLGQIRCAAEPGEDGSYRLNGQKVFISWADADFAENVCHLVLARLPNSVAGTRGLSLFLAPKLIPDENGRPGRRNGVRVVSLESKFGIHGSPTAVVEHEDAKCWLVGEPEAGMSAMFTMMNMARLGVGCQGVGVAEAAAQLATAHALTRKQGRSAHSGEPAFIAEHPNVRRLLAMMKARIFAARAICASCAHAIDMAEASPGSHWAERAAFLTPIAKAFGSETGTEVATMGIAVHGGMGYVTASGAAQFLRDATVATIYEGTNGIQALDLANRKLGGGGEEAVKLLDEIGAELQQADASAAHLVRPAMDACEQVRVATQAMVGQNTADRMAGAEPYLRAFALLLGSVFHLRAFLATGGQGWRAELAGIYAGRILPACAWHCREAALGADDLFKIGDEELAG